jgi:hypothetical protein
MNSQPCACSLWHVTAPQVHTAIFMQQAQAKDSHLSELGCFMLLLGITGDTLGQFLSLPRPSWSKVRWIHLEGVSGDALQVRNLQGSAGDCWSLLVLGLAWTCWHLLENAGVCGGFARGLLNCHPMYFMRCPLDCHG